MGRTLQQGILSTFWKPLVLRIPPLRTLLRTLLRTPFPFKTHYKTPSDNSSENLLQAAFQNLGILGTSFSESFFEACVAVRPFRRAPNESGWVLLGLVICKGLPHVDSVAQSCAIPCMSLCMT